MIKLRFSGIDKETEEKEFNTLEEAIDFSKSWFIEGYNNDTISNEDRKRANEYLAVLVDDLREGKTFHCGMFHERIEFIIP